MANTNKAARSSTVSFVDEIVAEEREALVAALSKLQRDPGEPGTSPFYGIDTLHFASFVIFDLHNRVPLLVFESSFDGTLNEYVVALTTVMAAELHDVFVHCRNYHVRHAADTLEINAYLESRLVKPAAYHIGNPGRPVSRIRAERQLQSEVRTAIDKCLSMASMPATAADASRLVRDIARVDRPQRRWVHAPHDRVDRLELRLAQLTWYGGTLGLGIAAALAELGYLACRSRWTLLPLLVAALIVGLQTRRPRLLGHVGLNIALMTALLAALGITVSARAWFALPLLALVTWLLWREITDSAMPFGARSVPHLTELLDHEDMCKQNHMASLIEVKDGVGRRALLRTTLWVINAAARTAVNGELNGIPSIHFAQWSLLDNGRLLLFLTNYDSTWDSYLDDFILLAHIGLTSIWSNVRGFPVSRLLILCGASNGVDFKAYSREQQTLAAVWYSAYPDLTVQQIDHASTLREGLASEPVDQEALREWLRCC